MSQQHIIRLARLGIDPLSAFALDRAGINTPALIRNASVEDIAQAVGETAAAAVLARFPSERKSSAVEVVIQEQTKSATVAKAPKATKKAKE